MLRNFKCETDMITMIRYKHCKSNVIIRLSPVLQDYTHELVCITEREKFIVPVRAIGARAVLDFPDEINFPIGPVKYTNTKTLLVRNIGNKEGKFTLSCER